MRAISSRGRLPYKLKPPLSLRGDYLSHRSRAPPALLTAWVAVGSTVEMELFFCIADRLGDDGRGKAVVDAAEPGVAVQVRRLQIHRRTIFR